MLNVNVRLNAQPCFAFTKRLSENAPICVCYDCQNAVFEDDDNEKGAKA